jgi:general secretion pathway protein M
MKKIRTWYAGLNERERRIVLIGGVMVAILGLVGGLLLPLQAAVSRAVERRDSRQQDLDWMRVNADEIRNGAMQLHPDTGEAPVVIVDRVGHESGLADALRGSQPSGPTGVRVQLEGAPFDPLIEWLGTLDLRYGLAVETITIDRTAKPGVVNASVTLNQPQR